MKYIFYILLLYIYISYSACYLKKEKPVGITAFNYNNGFKYELQLKYQSKGRGNVHALSLAKFEYDEFDWIYVNKVYGKINADSLVFTHHQRETEYPWNQSQLKGFIEFIGDSTVYINLMIPYYKDGKAVEHWKPYEFNGRYRLKVKNQLGNLVEQI